jgi:hypothetical protein
MSVHNSSRCCVPMGGHMCSASLHGIDGIGASRTIHRPMLLGESAMAIPCFVQGNHWVGLVRREVLGKIKFLYADALNNSSVEHQIKALITKGTNKQFCPPSADWITSKNLMYTPHSNECGPRMLIALTIMMMHPSPHNGMLIPYMHPNLAQIARTFVATTILTG